MSEINGQKQDKELVEYIVLDTEDGEKEKFQVLGYFDLEETGKKYVLLTHEDAENEEGEQDVFAYRYYEDGDEITLEEIESDEEWDLVEETLNTLVEEDLV
ncbi:DUF1292 domain-containing protein [Thermoflavimicrobium dichotomicum]|uniref:UPF0473 protein SAMN05421852_103237 n=1 Tax=Thermoflavimicrobium dichotomicum TaxID=46223 RepID=A0A1I3MWI1_9BACL|nr:DUF1292 domain-containing protein [Thermoflavimicrobium dichotomicum]SFJ01484.1 Uncharacterized protein YrzB, UPF0473 family [Thermoflavimicrobium dichotomicum]